MLRLARTQPRDRRPGLYCAHPRRTHDPRPLNKCKNKHCMEWKENWGKQENHSNTHSQAGRTLLRSPSQAPHYPINESKDIGKQSSKLAGKGGIEGGGNSSESSMCLISPSSFRANSHPGADLPLFDVKSESSWFASPVACVCVHRQRRMCVCLYVPLFFFFANLQTTPGEYCWNNIPAH